jgi:glycosyltransferase involved in cell wall biosynthesis
MLSFIIPAHNEEAYLNKTINAIHQSTMGISENYEILVVDDASTDNTKAVGEAAGAMVISVNNRKIAATRNCGAKAAKGDIFFFIDADTCINQACLKESLEAIKAGAVGGGCHFNYDTKLPFWVSVLHRMGLFFGRIFKLVGGCCIFVTREAFEKIGGFPEEFYAAEDVAFSSKLSKVGAFIIPKSRVTTSARKIWTMNPGQTIWLLLKLVFRGPNGFRSKKGLDLWYGKRPDDPIYHQLPKE